MNVTSLQLAGIEVESFRADTKKTFGSKVKIKQSSERWYTCQLSIELEIACTEPVLTTSDDSFAGAILLLSHPLSRSAAGPLNSGDLVFPCLIIDSDGYRPTLSNGFKHVPSWCRAVY